MFRQVRRLLRRRHEIVQPVLIALGVILGTALVLMILTSAGGQ